MENPIKGKQRLNKPDQVIPVDWGRGRLVRSPPRKKPDLVVTGSVNRRRPGLVGKRDSAGDRERVVTSLGPSPEPSHFRESPRNDNPEITSTSALNTKKCVLGEYLVSRATTPLKTLTNALSQSFTRHDSMNWERSWAQLRHPYSKEYCLCGQYF